MIFVLNLQITCEMVTKHHFSERPESACSSGSSGQQLFTSASQVPCYHFFLCLTQAFWYTGLDRARCPIPPQQVLGHPHCRSSSTLRLKWPMEFPVMSEAQQGTVVQAHKSQEPPATFGHPQPTKMCPAAARQRPHTHPTAPQPPNNSHKLFIATWETNLPTTRQFPPPQSQRNHTEHLLTHPR